ncbi:DNA topoisomerase-1 [Parabacteroides sp. PF5-5]|uniref:type I DNA topoisomerase n=1 Tax=unclassified Parabacteroides TaxID=2649774 RepID=UPI002473DE55|nr:MULTISPECIES: type I DNA topoisomerase [unclassified Parabacteroides]MDH6303407.1 DNA topoisomerase-1 [Parabacteroides sp. PH5-39]MDH6314730.1 DNA topoisomerase-1 [Parabacteroides sp. PF5-13]MDH6318067.1 DNA topoisomerase-1 [Parabacteroides sp. PH5-13]MDH6322002.1 DNA topoisomerase-1 [Parabacteroides sp. PH5-8]MDH6326125.1 DNA topoisomerase-1 [Parabacteroides sp. PH5-41]
MQKNLVIVESPAKAKTLEKFLGKDFKVMSSYGHIRDLKTKEFGIDIEHNYAPQYVVPSDKKKLVTELKAEAKKAEMVWLASDEDREGEAISWHLAEVLNLAPEKTKRIVFHEITKDAILHAVETPRSIDYNLVNAQQARRVLDRIVGFELSPILWRKVKPALSAGRVQSVAVRLIVEREREINHFVSEASFRVIAEFILPDGTTVLKAELNKRLKTKKEVTDFLESCKTASFKIDDISTKPVKKSPAPPFTTSTLQQEASRKLGYSVSQTMMLAQRLYESGFITYMRTDSVNLSDLALGTTKEAILNIYGEKYYHFRKYSTKTKGAQEAHEAIRPTYISNEEISGTAQEKKLYELIRKRTIACQMADAELERTTISVDISGQKEKFSAVGEVLVFDGFLQAYRESTDDESEKEQESGLLPPVSINDVLAMRQIEATERFTQRPPRYTEASLVRRLEELGIGRPSTYAPTIQTIQNREYVIKGDKEGVERSYTVFTLSGSKITEKEKQEIAGADRSKLMPTDIGVVVNDFLMEYFPGVLDYNFTASVEKEFDAVADGEMVWTDAIDRFYKMFHPIVERTSAVKTEHKVGERELGIDPQSGKPVFVKIGRFGPVAQLGAANPDDKTAPKPQFASLMKGQSIETITLEEALKLFELPRTIGEFEDKVVVAGIGRFGPFIRHDGKFISIPKDLSPLSITLDESIELIKEKRLKEAQRTLKTFSEEPEMEILNGRFGPYIAYKGSNYKIPKTIKDPKEITLDEALKIVQDAGEKPATKKRATKKK